MEQPYYGYVGLPMPSGRLLCSDLTPVGGRRAGGAFPIINFRQKGGGLEQFHNENTVFPNHNLSLPSGEKKAGHAAPSMRGKKRTPS